MKFLLTVCLGIFMAVTALAENSQQTTIGQIELSIKERNIAYWGSETPPANPFRVAENVYNLSGGGPRLDTLGIHLRPLMAVNSYFSWALGALLVVLIRISILQALEAGESIARLYLKIAFKFMLGIMIMNHSDYVYATGIILRDCGVYLVKFGMNSMPNTHQTPAGSLANIDFEQVRVNALRRALNDNKNPIIGNGSGITYDLYNQLRAQLPDAESATLPPIRRETLLQQTRLLIERTPLLLEELSRQPKTNLSTAIKLHRIGPDKLIQTGIFGDASSADLTSATGITSFYNPDTVYDTSILTVKAPTLVALILPAERIRQEFQKKADDGGFTSYTEYNVAFLETKTQYDDLIYQGTSSYIRTVFWSNVGFASGKLGGAPGDWDFLEAAFPDETQRSAVVNNAEWLGNWWDTTAGTTGGAYSNAQPKDDSEFKLASMIVRWLAWLRDKVILNIAFVFFDVVVEVYVFILFLTFPLWFYAKTAKAFTGAVNSYIAATLTPAVLTFLFLIFDQFMTKMLVLAMGSAEPLYSWMFS